MAPVPTIRIRIGMVVILGVRDCASENDGLDWFNYIILMKALQVTLPPYYNSRLPFIAIDNNYRQLTEVIEAEAPKHRTTEADTISFGNHQRQVQRFPFPDTTLSRTLYLGYDEA